jgi:hypothetical protein
MNRLELLLDIPMINKPPRKVNVRADLPVSGLITAIKDHFSLNGQYALFAGQSADALPGESALNAAGVGNGMTLRCAQVRTPSNTPALIESGTKRRFSQKYERVFLSEQRTFEEFQLKYWPAVIGRRDRGDPARNRLLAVDLEPLEETPTVSRHHACITEEDGVFYIEVLQTRNPVYLNGNKLDAAMRHPLAAGASLQVGSVRLTFNVRS